MQRSSRTLGFILCCALILGSLGSLLWTYGPRIEEKWWMGRLWSGDVATMERAAKRLIELRRKETVEPLIRLIESPEMSERWVIASEGAMYVLLGCIDISYEPLLRRLCSPHREERMAAARVLSELFFLVEGGVWCSMSASMPREIPEEMRREILEALKNAASDPDSTVRGLAMRGLCAAKGLDAAFAPVLFKARDDPDPQVRNCAMSALCRIPGLEPTQVQRIAAGLDSDDVELRRMTAFCLQFLEAQPKEVLPRLLLRLDDPDAKVREFAVESLWALGRDDPRVVQAIERAAQDPAPGVRESARFMLELQKLEQPEGWKGLDGKGLDWLPFGE